MSKRKLLRIGITMTGRAAKSAYRITDKAGSHLFKWVTTDHLNVSRRFNAMPTTGLADTLAYLGWSIVGVIISGFIIGVLTFISIAFVLPAIFESMFM
jgi:hypothetical protein